MPKTKLWARLIMSGWLAVGLGGPPAFATSRNEKVYQAVEASDPAVLDLLQEIVNIDSGTGDVAGGSKVEALLAERLRGLGRKSELSRRRWLACPIILSRFFMPSLVSESACAVPADDVYLRRRLNSDKCRRVQPTYARLTST